MHVHHTKFTRKPNHLAPPPTQKGSLPFKFYCTLAAIDAHLILLIDKKQRQNNRHLQGKRERWICDGGGLCHGILRSDSTALLGMVTFDG